MACDQDRREKEGHPKTVTVTWSSLPRGRQSWGDRKKERELRTEDARQEKAMRTSASASTLQGCPQSCGLSRRLLIHGLRSEMAR